MNTIPTRPGVTMRCLTALVFACLCSTTGCDDGDDALIRFALDSARSNAEYSVTIRACTCGEAQPAQGRIGYEAAWPAFDDCIAENARAIMAFEEHLAMGDRVALTWLCRDCPPGMLAAFWFVEPDRSGVRFWEQVCDTSPSSAECGWQTEDFDRITADSSTFEAPGCDDAPVMWSDVVLRWNGMSLTLP